MEYTHNVTATCCEHSVPVKVELALVHSTKRYIIPTCGTQTIGLFDDWSSVSVTKFNADATNECRQNTECNTPLLVISGFRRGVNEISGLLGCYAA